MKQIAHISNKLLLVLLVPVMLFLQAAKPSETDESAVKAMFIYNFAKYFDWSEIDSRQDFVIGVYGASDVTRFLDEIAQRKTLNGKHLIIKVISSPSEMDGMQMLFLPDKMIHMLEHIDIYKGSGKLIIITEHPNSISKGAHINLINIDGKLRFELNETLLRNNNIKYSRDLTSLAALTY